MMRNPTIQYQAGFTLLEVLVALAIISVGLLSISSALSRSIDVNEGLEERTVAIWIIGNKMAELRMERKFSFTGSNTTEQIMAGKNWKIVENYFSTADPSISRVVVEVYLEDSDTKTISSTGYLAKYGSSRI